MGKVTLPVDRLGDIWPERFRGARVGALLHAASVDGDLRPTLDVLEAMADRGQIRLTALFGPQHGFDSVTQDNMIEWEGYRHPRLGIPVHSLYGEVRQPTSPMLESVDVLFIDLVDVGSRYYTFIWTMYLCLEACERAGIPVVVADRPNPLGGELREGEPQQEGYLSFVGWYPLPNRHGETIGELALRFCAARFPGVDLTVLPMEGWRRSLLFEDTGLPWVMPSPNMPTPDTARVYPGMCLLEGTNLSEGRGTTRPFELFGAPWIEGRRLVEALRGLGLPGVHFRVTSFQPGFQKFAGEVCHGAQLHVIDRESFRPVATGLEIIRLVRRLYPDGFSWKLPPYEYETAKLPIEILCGGPVEAFFPE